MSCDRVTVGSWVLIRDGEGEDGYLIADEADPIQRRISVASPLGAALLGRQAGEAVRVSAPGGAHWVRILCVERAPARAARF